MLERIPSFLKNKYAITFIVFAVWMLFFDQNNLITQVHYRSELNKQKLDKQFYKERIKETKTDLKNLTTNPSSLEKFAREKYLMKKKDEEVFVIVEEE